jgi:hypothetical protein
MLVRPVAHWFVVARLRRLRDVPMPRDPGHGVVLGQRPVRVAFIGDATAVGYGTVSQQLGVAAHYARALSRRDRRGVEWCTAHFPRFTMRSAMAIASRQSFFTSMDRVVVIAGIGDAIGLMSVATWTRLLDEMLTALRLRLPRAASITIAEIPPLEFYSSIPPVVRGFVTAHADELNRATRTVAAGHHGVRTVGFSGEHVIDLEQPCDTGHSGLYLAWAQLLLAADPGGEDAASEGATGGLRRAHSRQHGDAAADEEASSTTGPGPDAPCSRPASAHILIFQEGRITPHEEVGVRRNPRIC